MTSFGRWLINLLTMLTVAGLLYVADAHEPYGVDEWTRTAIVEASEEFGVPYHELYTVAHCESDHFDPRVIYGPRTGALGEQGALQFLGGKRHHLWQRSPWAAFSPFDPHAAFRVTAWWWSVDPSRRWEWSCWRVNFVGRL